MLISILAFIGACTVAKWIVLALDASGNSGKFKHWLDE